MQVERGRMKYSILLFVLFVLTGCVTVTTLQPTGGSKSDGVVQMSYEVGVFDTVDLDWEQAQIDAKARCEVWGYSDAEKFGGAVSQCQSYNGYGNCMRSFVTVDYQCID
jgi:hypothetical protein